MVKPENHDLLQLFLRYHHYIYKYKVFRNYVGIYFREYNWLYETLHIFLKLKIIHSVIYQCLLQNRPLTLCNICDTFPLKQKWNVKCFVEITFLIIWTASIKESRLNFKISLEGKGKRVQFLKVETTRPKSI